MKKFLGIVLAISFGGAVLAGGCGDPCDKAFDKWMKCMKKQGLPEKVVKKMEKIPGSDRVRLISLNASYSPYEIHTEEIQEVWLVSSKITFGIETNTENGLLRELKQSMEELKEKLGVS